MKQRGRKSAASLAIPRVDGKPPMIEPPPSLRGKPRDLFIELANSTDARHLRPSDAPLLCQYVENAVLAETASDNLRHGAVIQGKPSPWIVVQEKAVRAMVSLSMRLRLSPQSRLDQKAAARPAPPTTPPPWIDDED